MTDPKIPDAREWKAYQYEEVYKIDVRGRVMEDGRAAVRAVLGSTKDPTALTGWSISEELPDGSTKVASIQEALQNLASQLTGK